MNQGSSSTPVRDAEWLAHRYDAAADAVHLRHVPRCRHSEIPFLTEEYLGGGSVQAMPFGSAVAVAPPGQLHFIFHSAFCASTLLTRAMDAPGLAGITVEMASGNSIALNRGPGGLTAHRSDRKGREWEWTVMGASRGESGILGEGIRQALLRDGTYAPALEAASAMLAALVENSRPCSFQ